MTLEHRDAIRAVIRGPISAMTAILSVEAVEQREIWKFWLDSLAPYRPDEISAALIRFARSGARYPNPQAIIDLIETERQPTYRRLLTLQRQAKEMEEEAELQARRKARPSPERAAEIMREAAGQDDLDG